MQEHRQYIKNSSSQSSFLLFWGGAGGIQVLKKCNSVMCVVHFSVILVVAILLKLSDLCL